MGFTNYLREKVLDETWGGVGYTAPGTLYVGLSTTAPADDGTNITEPSGGAYARVAVTNNETNWPSAVGGAKSNGTDITFPQATASWGTVGWFIISDATSGGNVLGYGSLASSKTIDSGDTSKFAVADLDVTLS